MAINFVIKKCYQASDQVMGFRRLLRIQKGCVKKLELKAGTTETSINTTDLPGGVYSISFQSGALKNTQQFIKE